MAFLNRNLSTMSFRNLPALFIILLFLKTQQTKQRQRHERRQEGLYDSTSLSSTNTSTCTSTPSNERSSKSLLPRFSKLLSRRHTISRGHSISRRHAISRGHSISWHCHSIVLISRTYSHILSYTVLIISVIVRAIHISISLHPLRIRAHAHMFHWHVTGMMFRNLVALSLRNLVALFFLFLLFLETQKTKETK